MFFLNTLIYQCMFVCLELLSLKVTISPESVCIDTHYILCMDIIYKMISNSSEWYFWKYFHKIKNLKLFLQTMQHMKYFSLYNNFNFLFIKNKNRYYHKVKMLTIDINSFDLILKKIYSILTNQKRILCECYLLSVCMSEYMNTVSGFIFLFS